MPSIKLKGYCVVNAGHLRTLEAIINLKIRDGWIPQGSVHSTPKPSQVDNVMQIDADGTGLEMTPAALETSTNWCQAMVINNANS